MFAVANALPRHERGSHMLRTHGEKKDVLANEMIYSRLRSRTTLPYCGIFLEQSSRGRRGHTTGKLGRLEFIDFLANFMSPQASTRISDENCVCFEGAEEIIPDKNELLLENNAF